ncbi:hypothetical protein [Pseudaeromonas paramecii]|uniref:Uncharacterized protein n=1 Tax=Pseudaeromonas paramecii TaxID=2138166 RepID=A0ABP8PX36_9GAMM
MRDFIGLLFLILAGMLVTKHFALGIPPFILGGWLLAGKGSAKSADGAAAILGGLGILAALVVIVIAIAEAIF